MFKRIYKTIAWILLVCMILGLIPSNVVYAADEVDYETEVEDDNYVEASNSISIYGDVYRVEKTFDDAYAWYDGDKDSSKLSSDNPTYIERDVSIVFAAQTINDNEDVLSKVIAHYYSVNDSDEVVEEYQEELISIESIVLEEQSYSIYCFEGSNYAEISYDEIHYVCEYEAAVSESVSDQGEEVIDEIIDDNIDEDYEDYNTEDTDTEDFDAEEDTEVINSYTVSIHNDSVESLSLEYSLNDGVDWNVIAEEEICMYVDSMEEDVNLTLRYASNDDGESVVKGLLKVGEFESEIVFNENLADISLNKEADIVVSVYIDEKTDVEETIEEEILVYEVIEGDIYAACDGTEVEVCFDNNINSNDMLSIARVGSRALLPDEVDEGVLTYYVKEGTQITFSVPEIENYQYVALWENDVDKKVKKGGEYVVTATNELKTINLLYAANVLLYVENSNTEENLVAENNVYALNFNGEYTISAEKGNEGAIEISNVTVNTRGVEKDFIKVESGGAIINPSVAAGKTVECTVEVKLDEGVSRKEKIKFTVNSEVTSVSIKGADKNNVIKQNTGVERSYAITYNKGANLENIDVVIDNNMFDGTTYEAITYELSDDKRTLKISTNHKTVSAVGREFIPDAKEFPEAIITIKDGDNELKSFTIKLNNNYLVKAVPNASVYYTTDDEIYLKVSLPSSYPKDVEDMRYEVMVLEKGNRYLSDIETFEEAMDFTENDVIAFASDISVADSIQNGGIIRIDNNYTINNNRIEPGKSYDIYLVCGMGKEEYSHEKKITATTKMPCYETNLSLTRKIKSFYADSNKQYDDIYSPILLAEAKFSKKTTYYGLAAYLINNNDGVTYASTIDGKLDIVNINKIMINDTSNLVPGDYTLYVYSEQADSSTEVKASCKITVTAPTEIDSLTGLPTTVYKKNKVASTFTVKPNFTDVKPANKKVTYEIVTDSDYVKKNVTISKDGKVTINKAFIVSNNPANNMFKIKVTPVANYSGSYYISHDIEITSEPVLLNSIKVVDDCDTDIGNVLTVATADGKLIQILDINGDVVDNTTLKLTSNNRAVAIDNEGRLSVTGVVPGGVTIKAETMDGGKSSIKIKIMIVYKSYSDLSLLFDGQKAQNFEFINYKSAPFAENIVIEVLGDGKSIDDTTNYAISITNAKLVKKSGNVYYYLPTKATSVVTLTDKTKIYGQDGYQVKYTIHHKEDMLFVEDYNAYVYASDGLSEGYIKAMQHPPFQAELFIGWILYDMRDSNKDLNEYFAGRDEAIYIWDKNGQNLNSAGNVSCDVYCEMLEDQDDYNKSATTKERYDNFRNSLREIDFRYDSYILEQKGVPGLLKFNFDLSNYNIAAGTYKYSIVFYSSETGEAITEPCDIDIIIPEAPKMSVSGKILNDVRIGNTKREGFKVDEGAINYNSIKNEACVIVENFTDAEVNGITKDYARYFIPAYNNGSIIGLTLKEELPDDIKKVPLEFNVVVYDYAGKSHEYKQVVNVTIDSSVIQLKEALDNCRYNKDNSDGFNLTELFGYEELLEYESIMSELQYNKDSQEWQDAMATIDEKLKSKIPAYVKKGVESIGGRYDSSKLQIISAYISNYYHPGTGDYSFITPGYNFYIRYDGYLYEGAYALWSEKCFEEQLSKYFDAFETYDECIEFMNARVSWIKANSTVSDGKLIITYHYSDNYNYDKEYTIIYEK